MPTEKKSQRSPKATPARDKAASGKSMTGAASKARTAKPARSGPGGAKGGVLKAAAMKPGKSRAGTALSRTPTVSKSGVSSRPGSRPASGPASRPATRPAPKQPPRASSKASPRPSPTSSRPRFPEKPATREGLAKGTAPKAAVAKPNADALQLLRQEKGELQEIARQLRAERDSALAETTRLQDRLREIEAEQSRRSSQEPQQAGPGGFDPSVDLEEDGNTEAEDDLEGAAGFFDRMDELRARRVELDRERADRELEQSDQPFWMICPKCGDLMEEQEAENVKLERCETCGGLYLDRGEADLLISLTVDREGLRRLHHALKF